MPAGTPLEQAIQYYAGADPVDYIGKTLDERSVSINELAWRATHVWKSPKIVAQILRFASEKGEAIFKPSSPEHTWAAGLLMDVIELDNKASCDMTHVTTPLTAEAISRIQAGDYHISAISASLEESQESLAS